MSPKRRMAAYRIAMRITPEPWNVTEVLQRCETIRRFIADDDFSDLRVQVLEVLTTALGLGPDRPASRTHNAAGPPPADRLVDQARRVLTYIQER